MLTTFLSLLPYVLAVPLAERQDNPTPFGLMALRSASPIHFGTINANGEAFWIGKSTLAFCPDPPNTRCPPDNATALVLDGDAAVMGK